MSSDDSTNAIVTDDASPVIRAIGTLRQQALRVRIRLMAAWADLGDGPVNSSFVRHADRIESSFHAVRTAGVVPHRVHQLVHRPARARSRPMRASRVAGFVTTDQSGR
jgi:hypothetical protein